MKTLIEVVPLWYDGGSSDKVYAVALWVSRRTGCKDVYGTTALYGRRKEPCQLPASNPLIESDDLKSCYLKAKKQIDQKSSKGYVLNHPNQNKMSIAERHAVFVDLYMCVADELKCDEIRLSEELDKTWFKYDPSLSSWLREVEHGLDGWNRLNGSISKTNLWLIENNEKEEEEDDEEEEEEEEEDDEDDEEEKEVKKSKKRKGRAESKEVKGLDAVVMMNSGMESQMELGERVTVVSQSVDVWTVRRSNGDIVKAFPERFEVLEG